MGNLTSSNNNNTNTADSHRRQPNHQARPNRPPPPPPPPPSPLPPQPHSHPTSARYVFAAATPYPTPYTNPGYYHHHYHPPGYYPAPPPPGSAMQGQWDGRYPSGPMMGQPLAHVEKEKAVTIRNQVNVKKESIKVEPDEDSPGQFLVSFTFDATLPCSITVIFFAKEGEDCNLTPTKESLLPPVIVHFEQGLGQKFKQSSGTGIKFSMFAETDLLREADLDVYPLAVKADACPATNETGPDGGPVPGSTNSQITQAVFAKDKGGYKVKVLKQILWVNGMRYELQEIYGIGNSVESDFDGNDPGKECVICLSEPRDTTVLPCRHMCMCSGCAKVLRFQSSRCPICRQPVERLLEIKVNNGNEEQMTTSS